MVECSDASGGASGETSQNSMDTNDINFNDTRHLSTTLPVAPICICPTRSKIRTVKNYGKLLVSQFLIIYD